MPHTLTETLALCHGSDSCDPLFDTSNPRALERISETPDGLLLLGIDEGTEFENDLLITPVDGGWTLRWRDPVLTQSEPVYGREWLGSSRVFTDWSDLVSVAYCL